MASVRQNGGRRCVSLTPQINDVLPGSELWLCPNMSLQILSTQSHSLAPTLISRCETIENQTIKTYLLVHIPWSYKISKGKFLFPLPQGISSQGEGCAGQTLCLTVPGEQTACGAQTLSSLEIGVGPSEVALNLSKPPPGKPQPGKD